MTSGTVSAHRATSSPLCIRRRAVRGSPPLGHNLRRLTDERSISGPARTAGFEARRSLASDAGCSKVHVAESRGHMLLGKKRSNPARVLDGPRALRRFVFDAELARPVSLFF